LKAHVEKAMKIISELRLTPKNINQYEECEIISDLLDGELLRYMTDEELRKIIQKMRDLHVEVRRMNYAAYIDMAKELFRKIPNRHYVLEYHELEQLSKKISDSEVKKIKEKNIREILDKVKHIHDNIDEKKVNVIRRIKMQ